LILICSTNRKRAYTSSIRAFLAGNTNVCGFWGTIRRANTASLIVETRSASWIPDQAIPFASIGWVIAIASTFLPEHIPSTSTICDRLPTECTVVGEAWRACLPAYRADPVISLPANWIAECTIQLVSFKT